MAPPRYVMGKPGSDICPGGYFQILNEFECSKAEVGWALPFGGKSRQYTGSFCNVADGPRGCTLNTGSGDIWFLACDAIHSRNWNAPVCEKVPAINQDAPLCECKVHEGTGGSDCKTDYNGEPFCYTVKGACWDGQPSTIAENIDWSVEACAKGTASLFARGHHQPEPTGAEDKQAAPWTKLFMPLARQSDFGSASDPSLLVASGQDGVNKGQAEEETESYDTGEMVDESEEATEVAAFAVGDRVKSINDIEYLNDAAVPAESLGTVAESTQDGLEIYVAWDALDGNSYGVYPKQIKSLNAEASAAKKTKMKKGHVAALAGSKTIKESTTAKNRKDEEASCAEPKWCATAKEQCGREAVVTTSCTCSCKQEMDVH